MKNVKLFICAILTIFTLAGCESLGWNDEAIAPTFTPGVSAKTKVRTWDENKQLHETAVKSEPAYLYDIQQ